MVRGCLIVLDVGEYAVRCRVCRWRSGGHRSLTAAIEAFDGHSSSPLNAPDCWASSRDQAGAWDERPCPQAPARQQPRRADAALIDPLYEWVAPAADPVRPGVGL